MKVWYDALTGKHLRYGNAIATRLRALGNEVIVTTRTHPDTLPLAHFLNEKCLVVGRYDPKSLLTRVVEGAKRQLAFCKLFEKDAPDIAISHGSVDQCRVAFGIRVPVLSTFDTPYAEAVHRLTLPLSNFIVASKAIPRRILEKFNVQGEILTFEGADEVAWIKDFKPKIRYDFKNPLIVVREFEGKAAYSEQPLDSLSLAKKLTKLGQIVFLSRYVRKSVRNLIVPKSFVDSASLASQADLIVGVGGTITREAALQGTPAIVVKALPKQHVNDYLAKSGFPIFKAKQADTITLAKKLLGNKYDVKDQLNQLENPVDTIENILKDAGQS